MSVVIHHAMIATPLFYMAHMHEVDNSIVNFVSNSPLHIFWGGHEAVLLFFVLSGFVLALPFLNNRYSKYSTYAIKRVCRIYIPYIISILLSAFLFTVIRPSGINGLSTLFQGMWSHEVSFVEWISYVLLLGHNSINLNGSIWSLVHEMRISFFFPVLMVFIIKFSWKRSLGFGIPASLFLWQALTISSRLIEFETAEFLFNSLGETFYYTSFFIMGAVLAKYKDVLIATITKIKPVNKILLFLTFVFLYNFEWLSLGLGALKYRDSFIPNPVLLIIFDFAVALSVVILFILVLSNAKINTLLNKKILLKLGQVSFSLYLIHLIVIITMVYALESFIPLTIILILVPPVSFLFAIPFYHFIEVPSIKLGKFLTSAQPKISFFETKIEKKRV